MAREFLTLSPHPGFESCDQRGDVLAAVGEPRLSRAAVDLPLVGEDRVDLADGCDGQRCGRRSACLGEIGELVESPSTMRPAERFGHGPAGARRPIEPGEAAVGVGLQDPGIAGEVKLRMLAAAIAGIAEERRRRADPALAEGPVVANIDPQSAGHGLALGQHRHGGVVAVQALGAEHVAADELVERHQHGGAGADVIGHGRHVDRDAFASIALALPVERLMGAILLEQNHRKQAGSGAPAGNNMEGCRWLGDRLAVPARELLAHGLLHEPAARNDIERLGDGLADFGQAAAAAAAATRGRRDHASFARQMLRERPAGRFAPDVRADHRARARGGRLDGELGCRLVFGHCLLELRQLELELGNELGTALGGTAILLAPRFGEQQFQPLDLQPGAGHQGLGALRPGLGILGPCLGLDSCSTLGTDHRVRRGEIGRKRVEASRHVSNRSMNPSNIEQHKYRVIHIVAAVQPAARGRQVCCGALQSMPSSK